MTQPTDGRKRVEDLLKERKTDSDGGLFQGFKECGMSWLLAVRGADKMV